MNPVIYFRENTTLPNRNFHPGPPGKINIAAALKKLLEEIDFNSITTAEIVKKTSG